MTDLETVDQDAVDEFMGKLIDELAFAAALPTLLLGTRLGLWAAMDGAGPLTPGEVSAACGLPLAFVREWLRTQAAGDYLDYNPANGQFELPRAVAAVLGDADRVGFVRGLAGQIAAWHADLPRLQQGLTAGGGLGWRDRLPLNSEGMDEISRSVVTSALTGLWLPALDVAARLSDGGRVADVGCGYGGAALAIAAAYSPAQVFGFDYDDASIARARRAASQVNLATRVHFEVADANNFPGAGYDLISFVDVLHDLGDPVGALAHARSALTLGGAVLLVEPAGADRVEDNFTPLGRMFYAASTLVCTPNALDQQGSDALGALAGPTALRDVATRAGFGQVRVVPAEAPFNLVLECRP